MGGRGQDAISGNRAVFWGSQPSLRTVCRTVSCRLGPDLPNADLKGAFPANSHCLVVYEAALNQDLGRAGPKGAEPISFSGGMCL